MKQQTAVEWLYENILLTPLDIRSINKCFEQAKEMEKEEIMMAVKDSRYMAKDKQTAVEWIIEQINNVKPHQFCSLETIKEWCEQAKAMEKEQIIEAASNNSAKEAYRAGQDSMYCGCYEIDGCTNYEEWIYKKQTNEEI